MTGGRAHPSIARGVALSLARHVPPDVLREQLVGLLVAEDAAT